MNAETLVLLLLGALFVAALAVIWWPRKGVPLQIQLWLNQQDLHERLAKMERKQDGST